MMQPESLGHCCLGVHGAAVWAMNTLRPHPCMSWFFVQIRQPSWPEIFIVAHCCNIVNWGYCWNTLATVWSKVIVGLCCCSGDLWWRCCNFMPLVAIQTPASTHDMTWRTPLEFHCSPKCMPSSLIKYSTDWKHLDCKWSPKHSRVLG
jgi:hypothetical protein